MEYKFKITQEREVALALGRARTSFAFREVAPVELIKNFQLLLQDYSFVIEAIQNGGVGKIERDEVEDSASILEELRSAFGWEDLHRNIFRMEDIVKIAEALEDSRLICQNIMPCR